jgi:hypothetical protein
MTTQECARLPACKPHGEVQQNGLPLAFRTNEMYTDAPIRLGSGDRILMHTDGVLEPLPFILMAESLPRERCLPGRGLTSRKAIRQNWQKRG